MVAGAVLVVFVVRIAVTVVVLVMVALRFGVVRVLMVVVAVRVAVTVVVVVEVVVSAARLAPALMGVNVDHLVETCPFLRRSQQAWPDAGYGRPLRRFDGSPWLDDVDDTDVCGWCRHVWIARHKEPAPRYIEAFKFVAADLTTRDHTFSYLAALRTGEPLVATRPTEHADPCPRHDGDGFCVAHTVAAATSGGIAASHAVGLLVTYTEADVLATGGDKSRVRALRVTGVFDPMYLIRLGLCADLRGADLGGVVANSRTLWPIGFTPNAPEVSHATRSS